METERDLDPDDDHYWTQGDLQRSEAIQELRDALIHVNRAMAALPLSDLEQLPETNIASQIDQLIRAIQIA